MFHKIGRVIVAATLGVMVASPAFATNWVVAESAHFKVYSDASAKTAQAYATRLEQYRYILSGFYRISKEDDETTPKLRVYFVNSFSDLRQTWPKAADEVAGYYKSCTEGEAAVGISQQDVIRQTHDVKAQDENTSQVVLFHEYAHDFMFQHSALPYPHWFVEGFAEYYSTTKMQDDQIIVGMALSWRVQTLTSPQAWTLDYADVLRDSWRPKDGRPPNPYAENAFYAQSWLLTHWVMSDPERNKAFHAFIDAYRGGEDPVAAFEKAFGVKVKDLGRTLDTYFDHLNAQIYRIHDMPVPQVTVAALPASASKLLLWDAADRICPAPGDRADLLTRIQAEAAKYPDDAFAEDVLARAEMIIGDESQALGYLKARVTAHPDDAEAQFMLGQTWYLMTVHKHINEGETADSQMKAARTALGRSYQLDPLNAPDLYYYSLALAVPGEPPSDNMIAAAMEAQALAPSESEYDIRAAALLIQRGRNDEAKTMLVPIASNPHTPQAAAWAANIIAVIDRKGTKDEIEAALRTPVKDSGPVPPAPKDGKAAPAK